MNTKLIILLAFFLSSTTAFANEGAAKEAEHQQTAEKHIDATAESHLTPDATKEHEQQKIENAHETEKHGK
jgi:hypothetical protein